MESLSLSGQQWDVLVLLARCRLSHNTHFWRLFIGEQQPVGTRVLSKLMRCSVYSH